MPATIAPIQLTRNNAIKPAYGQRFGNFDGVVHLPPVKIQTSRAGHRFSDLNNQQIYRTVCDWVSIWQQWQQKILLYSIANRCSRQQLDILTTSLEPLRHHAYRTLSQHHNALQKYYINRAQFPQALNVERLPPISVTQKQISGARRHGNKFSTIDNFKTAPKGNAALSAELAITQVPSRSLAQSLDQYATLLSSSVLIDALKEVVVVHRIERLYVAETPKDIKKSELTLDQYASLLSSSVLISAMNETVMSDGTGMQQSGSMCESPHTSALCLDQYADLLSSSTLMSAIHEAVLTDTRERQQRSEVEQKCIRLGEEPSSVDKDHKTKEANVIPREAFLSSSETVTSEMPVASSMPDCPPDNLSSPVITREQTRSGTRMSARFLGGFISFTSGSKRSGQSDRQSQRQSGSSCYRYSAFASMDVRTPDFFNRERTLLGTMQSEVRLGLSQRTAGPGNIPVPLQQTYKSRAWWPPTPRKGRKFQKAKKKEMSSNFLEQLATISEWLQQWESHERLGLLKEVVKKCGAEVLESLVAYIYVKIRDTLDINRLSDKLLLYILSYLPPSDIINCAKVCRRWRYLCAMDDVWIIKCLELGETEGIDDLPHLIELVNTGKMGVDWMLAYIELHRLVAALKEAAQNYEVSVSENFTEDIFKKRLQFKDKNVNTVMNESMWQGNISSNKPVVGRLGRLTVEEKEDDSATSDEEDFVSVMEDYDMQESNEKYLWTDKQGWEKEHHRIFATSFEYKMDETVPDQALKIPAKTLSKEMDESAQNQGHPQKKEEEEHEKSLDEFTNLSQSTDLLGKVVAAVKLEWETNESGDKIPQHSSPAGFVYSVKRVRKLQGHVGGVLCLQFDKRRLVTGGADHLVRLWDVRSGRSLHVFHGHKGGVRCVKFDNKILVAGSWDSVIIVWDIRFFKQKTVLYGHEDSVSCLCLSKDHIISGSHDHTIRVWSRAAFTCTWVVRGHLGPILNIVTSTKHVFSTSTDLTLRMTDLLHGVCIRVFQRAEQTPIISLSLSGLLLLGGDTEGRVHFWNIKTGEAEAAVSVHQSPVNAITYHKGRFYTGSSDGTVTEYDLVTMTCIRVLRGHKGPVRDVQVSDRRFVSCSDDGTIRIWDLFLNKTKDAASGQ
ncbi:uncharacterized protein LOC112569895 isoform X3 [Pomacea canaliculata]|uniref:uncharacterized protein LOC112569895 isoform X3 n=1 Tax=Pomacea canaliculata TaxID=400727 RepID=UPI000D734718|nr:uncharacterized protein LOC112569895 isoform X3 [Pomacea canaliculata]